MTREEAIEFGNMWLQINEDCKNSSTYKFFQMAIKALEQEPCEDVISRQAAIDAIWDGINMDIYTREVKECLEALPSVTPLPCGDAISRQMVLAILKDKWNMFSDANDAMQESIDTIEAIPSGTSKQKTGRWIPLEYDGYADGFPVWDKWECSKCGWEHSGDEESLTAFCPNCGAKMEVEE